MTIPPLDLILLLGSIQGLILSVLLWVNPKGNPLSNRLLATLIGLLAAMSFAVGVPIANRWMGLVLELVPFVIVMPIGPIIYFYTKSVLDSSLRIGQLEKRHFYTTILDMGAPLMGWAFLIGMLLGVFKQASGPSWGYIMDQYNTYVDIPRWLSTTIYLVLTKQIINRYQAAAQNQQEHQQNLRWLGQFVNVFLVFQIIWLIHLVPYIVPVWRNSLLDRFGWYPIYIPITILIYWLGLKGYLYSRSEPMDKLMVRSTGSELTPQTVDQVSKALINAMEQNRLFLDAELTVDKLGQRLQIPPKLISAVLNQHLYKNFNAFVNEYRVEAVKQCLANPAFEHMTLTGIAFDCGFNSQATFQRVFKHLTGTSPSEYVLQQKKNTSQSGI